MPKSGRRQNNQHASKASRTSQATASSNPTAGTSKASSNIKSRTEGHVPYPETPSFDAFLRAYRPAHPGASTIALVGTVKLHGANATILYKPGAAPQLQSRNQVVGAAHDPLGIHALLSKAPLQDLLAQILAVHGADFKEHVLVAGELAGRGVQRGVAIAELDVFYALFNVRIDGRWVDMRKYRGVKLEEYRVYNVHQYGTWAVTLDLAGGEAAEARVRKEMEAYTEGVETVCPFALAHGVTGAGEGLVWTLPPSTTGGKLWHFKTKGAVFVANAHAPRPARDPVRAFGEYVCGARRFEQGIEYLREVHGNAAADGLMKEFAGWVSKDALKEERMQMKLLGVKEKEAIKEVEGRARKWYIGWRKNKKHN